MICFNGPTSRTLISEIGVALKEHIESSSDSVSVAMDVFSVYIEMSQNIRHYSGAMAYCESDATATVVIAETADGRYVVSAGNVVQRDHGQALVERVTSLGLIDVARKSSAPLQCSLDQLDAGKAFFTIRATI